jgi:hypothetical protein
MSNIKVHRIIKREQATEGAKGKSYFQFRERCPLLCGCFGRA